MIGGIKGNLNKHLKKQAHTARCLSIYMYVYVASQSKIYQKVVVRRSKSDSGLTHKVFSNVGVNLVEKVEIPKISLLAHINELSMIPVNHIHTVCFSLSQVTCGL